MPKEKTSFRDRKKKEREEQKENKKIKNVEEDISNEKVTRDVKTLQKQKYVEKESKRKLIVVLEQCPLEVGKVGENYKLLNSDEHRNYLHKHGKNPDIYRPDVVHQSLLALFDSPLNKANLLQVYLHTVDNTLIEINPHTRVPRTYKRFAGLMVQLLYKQKITASDTEAVLFKVIKNPITDHLPSMAKRVALEFNQNRVIRLEEYVPILCQSSNNDITDVSNDKPVVFVVGGFATGDLKVDYVEEYISISNYPLSAAMVCMKICNAFEEHWQVL
ncbi:hypothetical protein ABK040_001805 [Willaertia magna]